jgi:hypothetical protein
MSLSHGDKAECKEIAREIVEEVLKIHVKICPHGRSLLKMTCISIGIAIGSGLTGGGLVFGIAKAIGAL